MSRVVQAVFEGGIFRPLEPVALLEHQRVEVTLPEPNETQLAPCTEEDDEVLERPWRGISGVSVLGPPTPIHLDGELIKLPPWTPQIIIRRRWIDDDDS